jgi:hypothetical protein
MMTFEDLYANLVINYLSNMENFISVNGVNGV